MKCNYVKLTMAILCCLPFLVKAQSVVNFSAAEGFSNGATLTSQTNWSASSWIVDTNNVGMVTTSTDWKRAAWQKAFPLTEPGDMIKVRVELNFSGIINEVNKPLFKVGFSVSGDVEFTNPEANTVFLSVINDADYSSPILHLRHNNNSNALTPDAYLELATSQGATASDDLAVEITLTLGKDASSSTVEAKLINITDATETELGMHTGVKAAVFSAAQSGLYPFFSSQLLSEGISAVDSNSSYAVNVSKLTVEAYSKVIVKPAVKRYIGDTSALDRGKYFNLHSTGGNDVEYNFFTDYNATQHGRGFWGPAAYAVQQESQVGVYPTSKSGSSDIREVSRYIGTEHPYNIYQEGINVKALSDWVVEYYKNFVGVNLRPEFYEPMNEPFVHARDFYNEPDWDPDAEARVKLEMAQVLSEIGNKIHATQELANMKVIGYAAAYPSFEKNDFSVWHQNMKMFMDVAGANMDALSIHLYDGVNQIGQDTRRSGSNMEAVLDLIESYSFQKWGSIKPHVISEYGGIVGGSYSDISNVQSIRSQNAILFGLFERQDITELTVPFTTGKSSWHITENNNYLPYKAVLFKPVPLGVPLDQVTSWEYTDRIYFYELWKNVSGNRVEQRSNNPDIQIQAFRDGEKLYVALNNLDDFNRSVSLDVQAVPNVILNDVRIKSLIINQNEKAQYTEQTTSDILTSYNLAVNETVVLEYTYDSEFNYDTSLISNRYYSNESTVQPIVANSSMTYTFSDVPTSYIGYATLRMSIGRKHEKSKSPIILFNGQNINVPSNWKGYNQINRDNFFGMIEIDVPTESIQSFNSVTLEFPDSGGHLSSLVLITQSYDQNVLDTEAPVITLIGESTISINQDETYTELGATATDNVDGDLTASIIIESEVDSSSPGTYTVTYNVSDAAGNAATEVIRTVNVNDSKLSLNTATKSTITIYPNPAIKNIHIDKKYTGKELSFFTLNGKEVYRTVYNGNYIAVGHMARGLYLVRLDNIYAKLVIE
jgi:hypothetical protein